MSTTVASDSGSDVQTKIVNQMDPEFVKCECCGLSEECTPAYISRIRSSFYGRWICGLCSEAVKDEIYRSNMLIGTEEAIIRHINFCKKFRSSTPNKSAEHLISAMKQLLLRSLDSPRGLRSTPSSPRMEKGGASKRSLTRSGSCLPTLAG